MIATLVYMIVRCEYKINLSCGCVWLESDADVCVQTLESQDQRGEFLQEHYSYLAILWISVGRRICRIEWYISVVEIQEPNIDG